MPLVISDCQVLGEMEPKVVWKSAVMADGEQSVMTSGDPLMPRLYADSLDSFLLVSYMDSICIASTVIMLRNTLQCNRVGLAYGN